MRIGWIGFHVEGLAALRAALEEKFPIVAVLTLRPEAAQKRSGAADYSAICREFTLPYYEIGNINEPASLDLLHNLSLELAFVIGWTQLVHRPALESVKIGMIGAHASLLPENRGRAPVNWAIIKGAHLTGNSLIWLAEDVDGGDLIDQTLIPITAYDTCATIYEKVAESNREMIMRALPKLIAGERPGRPQPHSDSEPLPGRRPSDGAIDWAHRSADIYNFVRALTRPYPGAFSQLDGQRLLVWECARLPGAVDQINSHLPGEIIGPVISPREEACGQLVACGKNELLLLLEVENEKGERLRGRRLSEQLWRGKILGSVN